VKLTSDIKVLSTMAWRLKR